MSIHIYMQAYCVLCLWLMARVALPQSPAPVFRDILPRCYVFGREVESLWPVVFLPAIIWYWTTVSVLGAKPLCVKN